MKNPDWRVWVKDKKECRLWLSYYLKKGILRKGADESRLYLRKTDHNLSFANWVLEKHKDELPEVFGTETFYDWVVNIYYYAIYHAVLALISKERYGSKNHSATLCFLIYHHYHKQEALGIEDVELVASSLNKEEIEIVGFSKELREKASYDVHESFERKLAQQVREQAVGFVNKIKSLII